MADRSVDVSKPQDVLRESNDAKKSPEETRKREGVARRESQILEEKNGNLVMELEDSLADFHRSQANFSDQRSDDSKEMPSACDAAESRVRELGVKLEHGTPPLIIVSPSASQFDSTPFLVEPKLMTKLSADDEAVIARLLSAIERLRGERDGLRRDLHFARIEHRFADDALRARLNATENEVRRLQREVPKSPQSFETFPGIPSEKRTLNDVLEAPHHEVRCAGTESASGVVSPTDGNEAQTLRVHLQKLAENEDEQLHVNLLRTCHYMPEKQQCDKGDDRLTNALVDEQILHAGLASRIANVVKAVEQRDIRLEEMSVNGAEFEVHVSSLQRKLSESWEDASNVETRHSEQKFSEQSSTNNDAAEALKSQLEVLEQRVLRRTEQIGMLQHDTKRLETNLRVAEETIGELTTELETLTKERVCLLEDCAQARETRDEAHRRIETLEMEIETYTSKSRLELDSMKTAVRDAQEEVATHTGSIQNLVLIIAESAKHFRALRTALVQTRSRLATADANLKLAEDARLDVLGEVGRPSSRLNSNALIIRNQMVDIEAVPQEHTLVRAEMQQKLFASAALENETQSREQDTIAQTRNLTMTIEALERQLAVTQATKDQLSSELEVARLKEKDMQTQLEKMQETQTEKRQTLVMTVASLEQALNEEQSSHFESITQNQCNFERQMSKLEAELKESRERLLSCQAEHADVIHDLTLRLDETKSRLAEANNGATYSKSLESELCILKSEHANALRKLYSQMDESSKETESLRAQLHGAKEAFADLESRLTASVGQYDAAQVEIRGLEHALADARTHLDEHEASIEAMRREKTSCQFEQTRLEAELDSLVTKHQHMEHQAKRSDKEIIRLKSEIESLCGKVVKSGEAAQTAEIHLSFKTNEFDQKLAMMERELEKQQSHRQCQENFAALYEKNEFLEEMLRMKSVEIEENDDRFIEALKEKKRLINRVESLSRKVQSLQTKLEAITPPSTTTPSSTISNSKTPSHPISSAQSTEGPSTQLAIHIISSPTIALQTRTPELSRRQFLCRIATPEHAVPPGTSQRASGTSSSSRPAPNIDLHQPVEVAMATSQATRTSSTSAGGKKRPAPDDFDSPDALPVQAIIISNHNSPPHFLRRLTSESRGRFTPTRISTTKPLQTASRPSSLLRRSALAEATNSPRGSRQIGLGQPTSSKPPVRGWLSRTKVPTTTGDANDIHG